MSLMVRIGANPDTPPRESAPLPDRLIAGSPRFRSWPVDESRGGQVRTGVWEATPGTYKAVKGEAFEFCHILEGLVELTEEGGRTQTLRAGDSLVLKPGFVGVWKTIEKVKKIFVVVE